jgi:2-keto-3-deoxy-L-arabinonate dehydratase
MAKKEFPKFRGMMPILATPVDVQQNLDTEDLSKEVEYCLNAGCQAVGTLAGASEYQYVSRKMRTQIIKTTVEATAGRVPLFIGVAACNQPDTVENAIEAEALGADMLMVCSPPVGSATQEELMDYYKAVCSAVQLPVIVQDTGASSSAFTPKFLVALYEQIENIGYVKAEGGYWQEKLYQLMKIAPEGLQVIGGAAGKNMLQMLRLGITAYMTGTEAQEIHNSVVQAYLSGDEDKAIHLYFTRLMPYLELYTATGFHTSLKHMLHRRGIFKSKTLIFPGAEKEKVSQFILDELDWMLDRIDEGRI